VEGIKDSYGWTPPRSQAAKLGRECYLKKEAVRRYSTYVSRAAFWGHEAVAKLLVEKGGAKLKCMDTKGQTPLHIICCIYLLGARQW